MKFLILASFVAVACATSLYQTGKHITVAQDGTITINNNHGRTLVINQLYGQQHLDFTLTGSHFLTKNIPVNDEILRVHDFTQVLPWFAAIGRQSFDDVYFKNAFLNIKTQGEFFFQIVKSFEGSVDDITYEKFLVLVGKAVEEGLINHQVYEVLIGLEKTHWESFGLDQELLVPQLYNKFQYQQMYSKYNTPLAYKHLYPYNFEKSYQHDDLTQQFYGQQGPWTGVYGNRMAYNKYETPVSTYYKDYLFGKLYPAQYRQQYAHGLNSARYGQEQKPFYGQYAQEQPFYGQYAEEKPFYGHYAEEKPFYGQYAQENSFYGQYAQEQPFYGQYAREQPFHGQYAQEHPIFGQHYRQQQLAY